MEDEGLTTQQWAVLGALSHPQSAGGVSIGDLARFLMVSRQNLSGLISRMERDGRVQTAPDGRDRRSRLVSMTPAGLALWEQQAQPKIRHYYEQATDGFTVSDVTHALHYLLKLLDNMQRIDQQQDPGSSDAPVETPPPPRSRIAAETLKPERKPRKKP